jgi:hypothetical protein
MCVIDQGAQPSCVCNLGYNNDAYSHYCCPDDGSEPTCASTASMSDGGEESGASTG